MNGHGGAAGADRNGMAFLECRLDDNNPVAGYTVFEFVVVLPGRPCKDPRPATVEVTYSVDGAEQTHRMQAEFGDDWTAAVPLDTIGIDELPDDTQVCCRLVDGPADFPIDPDRDMRCQPAGQLRRPVS